MMPRSGRFVTEKTIRSGSYDPGRLRPVPSSIRAVACFSAAIIAIAAVAAFTTGVRTPFQYDDLSTVVENTSIRSLSDIGLALSPPPNDAPTAGRPLLNLSYAIDYAIGGINVAGYHATNIALHVVCALLLFALVRIAARSAPAGLAAHADVIAAATTTIWAVHPLQIGSVTYISGRSEVLMAVWYLATLLAANRASHSQHRAAWTTTAVAACAIGMACKESMATAPLAVVLFDRAYLYRRFSDAWRERWRLYAGLAATWAIVAALVLGGPRARTAGFSAGISAWTYLLNQTAVILDYLRLAVWPDHLLFAYGEAHPMGLADLGATALVVPALVAGTLWLWLRRPALGFPALWVFLTLAPTSSIVPIATEAGATRRMYLPLAGIVVLFVVATVKVASRVRRRDAAATRTIPLAITSLLVIVLGVTTARQNTEFWSSEQLWRGSLEHWPSALAHRNLAAVLLQQGRRTEALDHLRAASARQPLAHYELGVALFDDGRPAEAISELQQAISDLPNDETVALEGRRVLARALKQEGRHRDASIVFGEIAALTPGDDEPRLSRADELLAAGDLRAAHDEYQRVLAAHPDHLGAMTNDGLTLLRMGRVSEALPLLRAAAERQPHDVNAYLNFASAAAAAGQLANATAAVCHAIGEAPGNPAARQFFADLQRAAQAAGLGQPRCPGR